MLETHHFPETLTSGTVVESRDQRVAAPPNLAENAVKLMWVTRNPSATAATPQSWRILIVDDEPLLRWSLVETLGARGYRVVEAGDAGSALRALRASDGDVGVVLLDDCLPDAHDLRLLSTLRHLSPATPVILMTTFSSPELCEQALVLGAAAVVSKPFELANVTALIEWALAARTERDRHAHEEEEATGRTSAPHQENDVMCGA